MASAFLSCIAASIKCLFVLMTFTGYKRRRSQLELQDPKSSREKLTLPRLKSWDSCFNHHCGLSENPWPAFVLHGVRRRFGLLPGARVPHGAQIQKSLCRCGEHRQSLLLYVHSRVYIAVMMGTAYRTCPFPDGQVLGFRIPVSADVAGLA